MVRRVEVELAGPTIVCDTELFRQVDRAFDGIVARLNTDYLQRRLL